MSWRRGLEKFLWIAGIALIALYATLRVRSHITAGRDVRKFEALVQRRLAQPTPEPATANPLGTSATPPLQRGAGHLLETPAAPPPESPALPAELPANTTTWSSERVREYADTLAQGASEPIAVLRIPKIGLEVPVFEGTDDFALNRGVGWIRGTARPGQSGNSGIAGHRDGFFRGLKDVVRGDAIELLTTSGCDAYRVEDIQIVGPLEVQVLAPTRETALTLVSCYPFYFVGPAPKRYIVRAVGLGLERPI